jgi:hypothetical protein
LGVTVTVKTPFETNLQRKKVEEEDYYSKIARAREEEEGELRSPKHGHTSMLSSPASPLMGTKEVGEECLLYSEVGRHHAVQLTNPKIGFGFLQRSVASFVPQMTAGDKLKVEEDSTPSRQPSHSSRALKQPSSEEELWEDTDDEVETTRLVEECSGLDPRTFDVRSPVGTGYIEAGQSYMFEFVVPHRVESMYIVNDGRWYVLEWRGLEILGKAESRVSGRRGSLGMDSLLKDRKIFGLLMEIGRYPSIRVFYNLSSAPKHMKLAFSFNPNCFGPARIVLDTFGRAISHQVRLVSLQRFSDHFECVFSSNLHVLVKGVLLKGWDGYKADVVSRDSGNTDIEAPVVPAQVSVGYQVRTREARRGVVGGQQEKLWTLHVYFPVANENMSLAQRMTANDHPSYALQDACGRYTLAVYTSHSPEYAAEQKAKKQTSSAAPINPNRISFGSPKPNVVRRLATRGPKKNRIKDLSKPRFVHAFHACLDERSKPPTTPLNSPQFSTRGSTSFGFKSPMMKIRSS